MLDREVESHQLPDELFCVLHVNPENPGPIMPRLGRFWVVPMQSSFLKLISLIDLPDRRFQSEITKIFPYQGNSTLVQ
jgi:hypothetical protein